MGSFTLMRLSTFLVAIMVHGTNAKQYSAMYTFMAEREECDGQCTYCRHAHNQYFWGDIRAKIERYVNRPTVEENAHAEVGAPVALKAVWATDARDIQTLIDWSWQSGTNFECIIGVIAMRMVSYGYSDPFQFNRGVDFNVLDWLDVFNANTGALDYLTSSWSAVISGGWPIFRLFWHIGRKVKDRLADPNFAYKEIAGRDNECDMLDSAADRRYRDLVRLPVRSGSLRPATGVHLIELSKGIKCPFGRAVALLQLASDMVFNKRMYQGSLKDPTNLVHSLVSTAQDLTFNYIKSKSNWSPYFDLITTQWPIWDLLTELSCTDSLGACAARSQLQCFDMAQRAYVSCPHKAPLVNRNFIGCGEHNWCTMPKDLEKEAFCIPFDRRPANPRAAFLLNMGHDSEERICSQCGQDGVLRTIFLMIGFREASGLPEDGGLAPYFVEFGARKPGMLNSAVLREHCGWDGLLMDGQPGETPHGACPGCPGVVESVKKEFVTAENLVDLFVKHNVPIDFDLLTIDTDYNDYWFLRTVLTNGTFRPRVIAVDFNPDLPLSSAKVVKYDATGEWDGTVYTVGSLLAYALMARHFGYSFAYALEMGSHAFFVRSDLLDEADRDLPLRSVRKMSHLPDPEGRQFVDVLYDFIPSSRATTQSQGSSVNTELKNAGSNRGLEQHVQTLAAELASLRTSLSSLGIAASTAEDISAHLNSHEIPAPLDSGASRFYDNVRHNINR